MREKADSATPMLLAESEVVTQEVFGKSFEEYQFRNVTVAKVGKEAILAVTKRTALTYGVIFVCASLSCLNPLKLIASCAPMDPIKRANLKQLAQFVKLIVSCANNMKLSYVK